jgi:hypothetical protein
MSTSQEGPCSLMFATSRDSYSSPSHLYLADTEIRPVSRPHWFSVGVEQCTAITSVTLRHDCKRYKGNLSKMVYQMNLTAENGRWNWFYSLSDRCCWLKHELFKEHTFAIAIRYGVTKLTNSVANRIETSEQMNANTEMCAAPIEE